LVNGLRITSLLLADSSVPVITGREERAQQSRPQRRDDTQPQPAEIIGEHHRPGCAERQERAEKDPQPRTATATETTTRATHTASLPTRDENVAESVSHCDPAPVNRTFLPSGHGAVHPHEDPDNSTPTTTPRPTVRRRNRCRPAHSADPPVRQRLAPPAARDSRGCPPTLPTSTRQVSTTPSPERAHERCRPRPAPPGPHEIGRAHV